MKVVEGTDMFHRRAQALLRPVLGTQLGRVFLVAAGGKLVLTAVGTELRGAMFSAFSMGRQPPPWHTR